MFNLGPTELLVLGLLIVLLFGTKKVPEFFASLGQGIREFKKALHSGDESGEETK
ncbi:MAG: hypothetical protein IMHGJWDQ_000907 [Candidatus Fervidibacter sp.]|mgnify:CR=1 FL=1